MAKNSIITKTPKNSVENTALRLKAVLEVLAAEDPSADRRISRGEVLAAAISRAPLEGRESELLASGAARGERALVNATSKLVKAGWITKEGRAGWSITAHGRRALTDFPDTADLLAAMDNPAPGTADAPETTPETAVEAVIEEALQESVVEPEAPQEQHGAHQGADPSEPSFPQPGTVVLAGNLAVPGHADWDPADSGLQFTFDRSDELWKLTVDLSAGTYEYKVALNGSWEENYGTDGHRNGANLHIVHDGGPLTFLYDHATHLVITKPDVTG
ncbi:glycosidase [Arthrobacter sp. ATA002]|uniref:pullulanase X25 domain-containing protein n=1 Tax=Arthrobacter sp. ATA002 TaxID=2991715 RepID=UPI0022A7B5AE|nr:glycosidase [Arthrobacter sp. ATA002]WAP53059.1 glycosidase [Arthrobacter sp. ATA002]